MRAKRIFATELCRITAKDRKGSLRKYTEVQISRQDHQTIDEKLLLGAAQGQCSGRGHGERPKAYFARSKLLAKKAASQAITGHLRNC